MPPLVQFMLFVIVMLLTLWGFGIGMVSAIWLMAAEPCCAEGCRALPVMEEFEFKKSA